MGASLTSAYKTVSSDEESLPPPAKRARLEPDLARGTNKSANNFTTSNNNTPRAKAKLDQFLFFPSPTLVWLRSGSSGLRSGPQQLNWEKLPYVALVEIFRHLPNNDKFSAALACRSWQLPFHRPALWRRGNFRFNGLEEWRALSFVSLMGAALRHVTIDCSADPETKPSLARDSAKQLSIFLTCLVNSGNRQVSTFRLTHLRRLAKHLAGPDCDVIRLLTKFLEEQEALTSLDLQHAGLGADQAFQVLASAADSCETSVQSLSISEVICPVTGYDMSLDPRLLSLLARFTALTELSISHRHLSDDLLFLLASTLSLTLTQICVWAGYLGRVESRTSPRAWTHLVNRCPRLAASFTVKGIRRDQCLQEIVTPGTPLTRLQLDIGGLTNMVNTAACYTHITTHFHGSLRHLELHLQLVRFDAEEDLVRLVEQCYKLETLHITFRMADFRQELCVQRAVRRAVARQPSSRLEVMTFNGHEVNLETTWATSFVDWLTEQLQ